MSKKEDHTIPIETALEGRILHGLASEWETARWHLDRSIRERLTPPQFSLRNMRRRIGVWSPVKREISLNRQFVVSHPWHAVREVLFHEMAHQIADEVLGATYETSHGPLFKKACRLLRIEPGATAVFQSLDDLPASEQPADEDRILGRIRKLLALASSQNTHEAEAAMLKAHELIAKYHVDLLSLEKKRDYVSRLITLPEIRHGRDKYFLASLLQDFYFVRCIWVSAYVVENRKMGRALEISGTAQDIDLAAYVFDFVTNFIDSQWREYQRMTPGIGRRKIDFAVGVVTGFTEKLTAQKADLIKTDASYALIELPDAQLGQYMAYKHPRLVSIRQKPIRQNRQVVTDGKKIGRKLVIYKGITRKGQGPERLPMPEE